jgi:large subunit ribosomal protein L24
MVISGDHKGSVGEVMRVDTKTHSVVIKGINLKVKHMKPNRINPQGSIVSREAPVRLSKVQPVVDGKPTRVRFTTRPDGTKVRVAVKGGKELSVVHGPREK